MLCWSKKSQCCIIFDEKEPLFIEYVLQMTYIFQKCYFQERLIMPLINISLNEQFVVF